ncbi:hypothetical protein BC936DRAFT_137810 [Jimgerdemannia flammicorona]|uniref:BTB domain-containing protein n=1 Tax=Jimgerdemannia flammicorona TaxID=994334 RepID=A0A433CWM2_9FUNG|nr:hypothetical protein BC936DRAFT_137810 [Jimgerdemannia flammicorona]
MECGQYRLGCIILKLSDNKSRITNDYNSSYKCLQIISDSSTAGLIEWNITVHTIGKYDSSKKTILDRIGGAHQWSITGREVVIGAGTETYNISSLTSTPSLSRMTGSFSQVRVSHLLKSAAIAHVLGEPPKKLKVDRKGVPSLGRDWSMIMCSVIGWQSSEGTSPISQLLIQLQPQDDPAAQESAEMPNPELGFNLKQDLKATLNNPDYSDVIFTCKDGVIMYASRLLLSIRSERLHNLLCKKIHEPSPSKVSLPEITSVQLAVVLEYCYMEETPSLTLENVVEVFMAAEFFILPRLQEIVADYVKVNITDFASAGRILSKAVEILETNTGDNALFVVIRQYFLSKKLVEGQLASLSRPALKVLLEDTAVTKGSPTDSFDLFRFVVDWAFEIVGKTSEDEDRKNLLAFLNNPHDRREMQVAPSDYGISSKAIEDIGKVIMPAVKNIPFGAMCLHQLAAIVDIMTFIPDNILCAAFREHVEFGVVKCATAFQKVVFTWNVDSDSRYASYLQLSENKSKVTNIHYTPLRVRHDGVPACLRIISDSALPTAGLIEWSITIHTIGNNASSQSLFSIGLAKMEGEHQWRITGTGVVTGAGTETYNISSLAGTTITFRANMTSRVCTFLVNGIDQNLVWKDFPEEVYLSASLPDGASCEFV